jgi:hypothetical protein
MELAGLEPATPWVRYRANDVIYDRFVSFERCSALYDAARFAQFGSTDGRSASYGTRTRTNRDPIV